MAFAYRQSACGDVDVDNVTLNSVQAGSLVIVFYASVLDEAGSVSCSDGSSLSACTDATGTYTRIKAFYHLASGSGNKTYTITGETGAYSVSAYEFSYSGSCEFDVQNSGYGDATSPYVTGNITTTGAGSELVIAAMISYASFGVTSPTINGVAADATSSINVWSGAGLVWWRIVSSTFTGAAQCADASPGYWVANVISFKEVTGGATAYPYHIFNQ